MDEEHTVLKTAFENFELDDKCHSYCYARERPFMKILRWESCAYSVDESRISEQNIQTELKFIEIILYRWNILFRNTVDINRIAFDTGLRL